MDRDTAPPAPDQNADLWEAHADWWQREFTDGADPEYTEQILPIVVEWTAGAPRVLEVGTGSGYQAAVLARLCRRVYTMDRFRTLVEAAEQRFRTLRIANITAMTGDGMKGWPEQAPFDRIIVTAAGEAVPEALKEQVKVGGVIVMPVGPQDGVQKLMRLERMEDGFNEKMLADVRFVPLIPGKAARL